MMSALRLLRPQQWIKNAFVLAGVFFAGKVLDGDVLGRALLAFAAFCLASSAVYVFNDLSDREADRLHPRKRNRPLASGSITARFGIFLGMACATGSFVLAATVGVELLLLLGVYVLINAAYSRWLKHMVLLDVFCIAAGFLLRLLAGTWGIGVPPSQWFVLCTFLLSLFLGFAKRYAERMDENLDPDTRRAVVEEYSPEFLRMLLAVTSACTLMAYGLYTMNPATAAAHGTERLIYTLPLAAFVMFRYLYLVMARGFGENLSGELVRDRGLAASVLVYLALTAVIIL